MGRNQYWAGRVYDLCVYYMTGTPEGSTESGFYGEAVNRTCDPWFTRHSAYPLHHGALIHYTTAATLKAFNRQMVYYSIITMIFQIYMS